jgi:nuclear pore complex protein Nup50
MFTASTSLWSKLNGKKESEKTEALDSKNTNVYLKSIEALNHGVCAWIQKHVDQNPFVDLTPVFNDYRKHMNDLESKVSPCKDSPGVKPLSSVTPPSSFVSKAESSNEQQSGKSLNFQPANVTEVKNDEKPFAGKYL